MTRSLLLAAVLATALPIAACGSTVQPDQGTASGSATATSGSGAPAPGGAPADPKVAWVDKMCGEVLVLADTSSNPPPGLQDPDPSKTIKPFSDYVGSSAVLIDKAIANLKGVGPSPVEGGDQAVNTLVTTLDALKKSYQDAKAKLDAVKPGDSAAAQAAMIDSFTKLSAGGSELAKTLQDINANKAIADPSSQAPNCQKLNQGASTPPPTT